MRMVVRVHYGTADCRADTHVTLSSCLTDINRLCSAFPTTPMVARQFRGTILISPDGSLSVAYLPSLAITCAPFPAERTICPPWPAIQLNVVYHSTNRDLRKRQAVSYVYLSLRSVHDLHAVLQALRCKDVSLLAVCVADQCDVCCSVRIILDTDNRCRDTIFISLEIDDSVFSSGSATVVSYCDLTLVVTASSSSSWKPEGISPGSSS